MLKKYCFCVKYGGDKTFELAAFTTDPVLIPDADKVELSYNKRESVLRQDKLALQDVYKRQV